MKKFNIIAIAIIAFCTFKVAAFAASRGYNLAEGESQEGYAIKLVEGDAGIYITNKTPEVNATIGASISKKGLFGNYSSYDRKALNIKGNNYPVVKYSVKDGTYKPYIVHNTTGNGQRIIGEFYLAN